jgi:hypothetical protein
MFDCLWRRGGLKVAVRTGGVRMSGQVIIQYATLISLEVGILGLGIAVLIHRQQVPPRFKNPWRVKRRG